MDQHRSRQLFLEEQAALQVLKAEHPEMLESVGQFSHQDILKFIGITVIPDDLPIGYIRFRPEDFIVEEINQTGVVSTIDPASGPLVDHEDHRTLYCQMIKIGIGTPTAIERVAKAFNLNPRQIGFAGLKDAGALTSQWISLRGVTYEQVSTTPIESVILKNFAYGSGALAAGQLQGNRFTLTIRMAEPYNQAKLEKKVEGMRGGVVNFFSTQRFGHRFLAHHYGRLILQGDYAAAVRDFLTATNSSEKRFRADVRQKVEAVYGDWAAVEKCFQAYPYSFQHELAAVSFLKDHPDDWIGALLHIQDQTNG